MPFKANNLIPLYKINFYLGSPLEIPTNATQKTSWKKGIFIRSEVYVFAITFCATAPLNLTKSPLSGVGVGVKNGQRFGRYDTALTLG